MPPPAGAAAGAPPLNFVFAAHPYATADGFGLRYLQVDLQTPAVISALSLSTSRLRFFRTFEVEYVPWTVLEPDFWQMVNLQDVVSVKYSLSS